MFSNKTNALNENDLKAINNQVNSSMASYEKIIDSSIKTSSDPYFIKIEEKINSVESRLNNLNKESFENYSKILEIINKNQLEINKTNVENNDKLFALVKGHLNDFTNVITKEMMEIKNTTEKNLSEIKKDVDEKLEKTLENRLKQSFDNVKHNFIKMFEFMKLLFSNVKQTLYKMCKK
jgi:DNA recombination protein RmuC